jgi:hypothetical protein
LGTPLELLLHLHLQEPQPGGRRGWFLLKESNDQRASHSDPTVLNASRTAKHSGFFFWPSTFLPIDTGVKYHDMFSRTLIKVGVSLNDLA